MVNLKLITYVTPSQIKVFSSIEGFWAYRNTVDPANTAVFTRARQSLDACDQHMSRSYHVSASQAKNTGFIFGTVTQAYREMTDRGVRNLLFNENNQVLLIVRQTNERCYQNLIIVFTADHFTVITSNWGGSLRHPVAGETPLEIPVPAPAGANADPDDLQGAAAALLRDIIALPPSLR